jgi:hypothetical protein|tara:strand:+ start:1725 stop:3203 length:1479 start_codon:yes stop_codon:yes gene_type:complete
MKKSRTRLRGTKTAAKSEQKKLVSRLKVIHQNPSLLLPKTRSGTKEAEVYSKVLNELELAKKQYDNPPSFISSIFGSKPKDPLAKAYGASLTIINSGAPVMAIARFPHGEVNYVLRGSGISKEKLIGIQNHENRLWSRFAHLDYVKKHKFFIYILQKGMVCTGTKPKYPKELWDEACNDIKVKVGNDSPFGLEISCESLGETIIIPAKRMSKSKENSYSHFLKHQVAFEPNLDFILDIKSMFSDIVSRKPEEVLSNYGKGLISDNELWSSVLSYQKKEILENDQQYFIVSDNIFTKEKFMDQISNSKIDEAIVEDILSDYNTSVVLDNMSLSSFTEFTWDESGKSLVNRIDPNEVNNYVGDNSLDLLRKLYNQIVKESLTSEYPKFKSLNEPLKILDNVVRLLKVDEKARALKLLENLVSNNNMTKSISWSILVCLKATSSRAWKYSKEEKALGDLLSDNIDKLIKSKPEGYTTILELISERIGLGNKLEVI